MKNQSRQDSAPFRPIAVAYLINAYLCSLKNLNVIYPAHFEEKVGFAAIRKMLKKFCISRMGEELANSIVFMTEPDRILRSHRLIASMRQLMAVGMPFPVKDYFDLRAELRHLRIEGTVIEDETLFGLKLSFNTLKQILTFTESEASITHPELRQLAEGLFIDKNLLKEVNRLMDDKGEIPDNASDTLAGIRQDIRRKQGTIERKIRQMLGEAKQAGWSDSDTEITIRSGRMVIPVRAADKRKIKGFIHDESATGQTVYIEPAEIFDTNNEIRELEYAEKREIHRLLAALSQQMRPFLDVLLLLWDLLGTIDLYHAKALLSEKIKAVSPQIEPIPLINWKQAVHPLLELSLREQNKHAVPLDLRLDAYERILVISGPNAGGKSVCLKTAGLLQYMLQCGLQVPMQENSVCGIFQHMFIDIGDEQSLENDLSTYSSHLLHMRNFLEHANEKSLFLIDEFGTGTEPQSGGAIAEAVLEELNAKKAYGLVTTHYANLKLLADKHDGVINGAMLFDTRKMQPLFVLQTGKPGSSFAFEIARKTGLPEKVLEHAANITGHSQLNFEQQLQQLEIEKVELAKKQTELRIADNLLNDVITKYKRLHKQLEERKKTLLLDAGREAKALIDKANRQIENTIREIRESQAEKEKTKLLREKLQAMKPVLDEEAENISESLQINEEKEEEGFLELKAGDLVRIEEMDIIGELLQVNEHEAVVAFNAVKLRTSPEKLTKLSKKEVKKETRQTVVRQRSTVMADINEKVAQFKLTIDVRGKRAEEAMEQVGKYLDEAMLLSIKEVNVLHGKGNGILRRVLREALSKMKEVASFEDAPAEAGGHGITRVRLR